MKIGNGNFIQEECIAGMLRMDDESIDMVVTSPPYDELRSYNGQNDWNFDVFRDVANQLSRIIKKGGVIVWNVSDATIKGSETGSSFRQALYFKDECGLNIHDTMIWQKPTFSAVGALKVRYAPVFEYMFVFSKGSPKTFNPLKDRPCKSVGQTRKGPTIRAADGKIIVNKDAHIGEYGQRFNVWNMATVSQKGDGCHPAPFPLSLANDHILSWSNPEDIVLDPFAGSGTTAIAAENCGRKWICIERDPGYSAKAIERIAKHIEGK